MQTDSLQALVVIALSELAPLAGIQTKCMSTVKRPTHVVMVLHQVYNL